MAMLEGLDPTAQLGFTVLEVESNLATVVSWATLHGSVR